jgi:tetratricopeptide (TPR) repeat protein
MNETPLDQLDDFSSYNSNNYNYWALLVTYNYVYDAELLMLKDALDEVEIPNHVLDKSTGLVNPMLSGQKGAVQLYVAQDRLEEAQEIYTKTHQIAQEIYDKEEKNDKWKWVRTLIFVFLALYLLGLIFSAGSTIASMFSVIFN